MRIVLPLLLVALAGCMAQASPSHQLASTDWRLVSIDGKEPASEKAGIRFSESQINATAGCNSLSGPWSVKDKRLMAGPLMRTEMYCAGDVWTQEQAISALLVAAPELSVEDDRLTLRSRGHWAELSRIPEPINE